LKKTACRIGIVASAAVIAACASQPDHFYTLNVLPEAVRTAMPTLHVRLAVSLPPLVDRPEMVLNTPPNGIVILDHERWAVALSDQVTATLARDLEARRGDVFVADRRFDQAASPPVTIKVDIARMSAQRGGHASIAALWRMVDPRTGGDQMGSAVFEAPVNGDGYGAVAEAYSQTLSALADRLAHELGGS
jgi:uncharacterized lipoprotein YmbA